MKIFYNKKNLLKFINNEKNLGFVPTMGGIHKGHISLVKNSIKKCKKTIVSIFVNKAQFNNRNDFKKYPRNIIKDISILKKAKVNYLYMPSTREIYPKGTNSKILINKFSKKLCGKFRPGHFKAVVDVINRFSKIIKPNKIFLGKKDMQQLLIVWHFLKKNYPNIKVIGCDTIRQKNGVALSSRNFLLTSEEDQIASKVYHLLVKVKKKIIKGEIKKKVIIRQIINLGIDKLDYLELIDINKLSMPFVKKNKYKIFIAYYLGSTRLIDNI